MKASRINWVLALGVAGLLYALLRQYAAFARLQTENERLRADAARVQDLQSEVGRLRQINLDADELARLRQERSELVRLRGEVGRLRQGNEPMGVSSRDTEPVPGQAVLLTSKAGRRYVGDQLQHFQVDAQGAISSTNDAWISLHNTEGKAFRLSGQVLLGGPSPTLEFPEDAPDGFGLFLREWDSLHRYQVSTRLLRVKRRSWSNGKEQDIVEPVQFQESPQGQWLPFVVEASAQQIAFQVGTQTGTLPGPLDMDGANKIALAPGTKVKDVQVQILPDVSGSEPGQ
jgi:hypothetical protein